MNKYIFSIFSIFAFAFQAHSAVWYVATTGNDNNAGDLAHPFKTLPAAIDAANPGDEIQLRGGNYISQEIRVNKSNLYIRSFPGEWAVLTAVTNVEDISACIWYNEPETTGGTLENIEIVGGYYYGIKFETNWDWDNAVPFAQRRGVSNVTVRGCKIHDTGRDGIKLTPACSGISIVNCEIYYTGTGPGALLDFNAEGIDNVNAPNLTVKGCHIHDVATTGIYVKGGGQNCVIEGNTIRNCGEGGVYLGFYTDAEWFNTDVNPDYYENINGLVINNLITNTQHAGIGLWGAKDAKVFNNTVTNGSMAEMACLFLNTADVWLDDNNSARPGNTNVQVKNNIFIQGFGNTPMVRVRENALSGSANVIDYNCYYRPGGSVFTDDNITWEDMNFGQWKTQSSRDAHSFDTDPLLDEFEHLSSNSPCINSGSNTPLVTKDIDGHTRTDGAIDIGADEYGTSSGIFGLSPSSGYTLRLLGNPATSQTVALLTAPADVSTTLLLTGMDGRVLLQRPVEIHTGDNYFTLDIHKLPKGFYVLEAGMARDILIIR